MRINKFLALHGGVSRRKADALIATGQVSVNGQPAEAGRQIQPGDTVVVGGKVLTPSDRAQLVLLMLHKPPGYVCSHARQGRAPTIFDLLPGQYGRFHAIGRLDKDSSGLLLLTNDGDLANELAHPSRGKVKRYKVRLDVPLKPQDRAKLEQGIALEDGPSRLALQPLDPPGLTWEVKLLEGRNRQIRRSFAAAGYRVTGLHRTDFGPYALDGLEAGNFQEIIVK